MTEKQLHARIDRLQELIAGRSKAYTQQRYPSISSLRPLGSA
jgi:hypothetical protein